MNVLFCGTSDHPPYLELSMRPNFEAHCIFREGTLHCSIQAPTKKLGCTESLQIMHWDFAAPSVCQAHLAITQGKDHTAIF
jgi:hypothetical protein